MLREGCPRDHVLVLMGKNYSAPHNCMVCFYYSRLRCSFFSKKNDLKVRLWPVSSRAPRVSCACCVAATGRLHKALRAPVTEPLPSSLMDVRRGGHVCSEVALGEGTFPRTVAPTAGLENPRVHA